MATMNAAGLKRIRQSSGGETFCKDIAATVRAGPTGAIEVGTDETLKALFRPASGNA